MGIIKLIREIVIFTSLILVCIVVYKGELELGTYIMTWVILLEVQKSGE